LTPTSVNNSAKSLSNLPTFGMVMSGRSFTSEDYRYGFNGKEQDKEGMGGGGSTYDYGFRIYNAGIAKFLSVDPLTASYPWYTPYQFAGNKPIWMIDRDGLEEAMSNSESKTEVPPSQDAIMADIAIIQDQIQICVNAMSQCHDYLERYKTDKEQWKAASKWFISQLRAPKSLDKIASSILEEEEKYIDRLIADEQSFALFANFNFGILKRSELKNYETLWLRQQMDGVYNDAIARGEDHDHATEESNLWLNAFSKNAEFHGYAIYNLETSEIYAFSVSAQALIMNQSDKIESSRAIYDLKYTYQYISGVDSSKLAYNVLKDGLIGQDAADQWLTRMISEIKPDYQLK